MRKQVIPLILVIFQAIGFSNNLQDPIKIFRNKNTLFLHTANKIEFAVNSTKLDETSIFELSMIAVSLVNNNNLKVEIAVHNDTRSDPDFSKKITQERAETIKEFLANYGVNSDNLVAVGYGDSQIINKCKPFVKCTPKEHSVNRRVELKILNPEVITDYIIVKKH